jgi:hypothetical protein
MYCTGLFSVKKYWNPQKTEDPKDSIRIRTNPRIKTETVLRPFFVLLLDTSPFLDSYKLLTSPLE